LSAAVAHAQWSHPNIVSLYAVTEEQPYYIIMELCSQGDFLAYLRKNPNISKADRLQCAIEVAAGMEYLSNKMCIHRDLAARNCLVAQENVIKVPWKHT